MFNNDVNVNYDVAGHVHMKCDKQEVYLDADSVSALSGEYIRMYGHVAYRDSIYVFDADTMIYTLHDEHLRATGTVTVLDKTSGSTLAGPWVDYYRAVKGIRDSARVEALQRPTVRYFNSGTMHDTIARTPYILIGDKLKGFGQSRLNGSGAVTIDRDSLHGEGDSLAFDRGETSIAQLIGAPAKVRRRGADSFVVYGKGEIRLRTEHDTIRGLQSFLTARVTRGTTDITGDTIHLSFAHEKLGLTLAWNKKSGAMLHSAGYDVAGDSLAVETPDELLREIRVFRHAVIKDPLDSATLAAPRVAGDTAAPDSTRNTLWGERIVAHFEQVDSSATVVTRLRTLQSFGKLPVQAQSLSARTEIAKDGKRSPSFNYTRADTIFVVMKGGDSIGVNSVQAFGHVTGLQLETASVVKAKADSTKAAPPKGGP